MKISLRPAIILVPCLLGAQMAVAANLVECRALVEDAARLACYDALAAAPDIVTVPLREAQSGAGVPLAEKPSDAGPSLLAKAWELDDGLRGHILRIRPYKPVYILPYFHSSTPNRQPASPSAGHSVDEPIDLGSTEAKLQISLKTKLAEDIFGSNGDLWFGYTQSSRWQVYNGGLSRPFRETNHEPEAMLVWRTDYSLMGWRGRFVGVSLNHQSNGRSLPLSRSWNRVMFPIALERGDWSLTVRPWWRIPENRSDDDNPDIADYMGRGDLHLLRRWGDHQFSVMLRHSLRGGADNHAAVQLDYAFPIAGELRGHLQWFSGYGESMIDYNHRSNYYGVGVSLIEW